MLTTALALAPTAAAQGHTPPPECAPREAKRAADALFPDSLYDTLFPDSVFDSARDVTREYFPDSLYDGIRRTGEDLFPDSILDRVRQGVVDEHYPDRCLEPPMDGLIGRGLVP